jgi:hypothetical protein
MLEERKGCGNSFADDRQVAPESISSLRSFPGLPMPFGLREPVLNSERKSLRVQPFLFPIGSQEFRGLQKVKPALEE